MRIRKDSLSALTSALSLIVYGTLEGQLTKLEALGFKVELSLNRLKTISQLQI
jgi:hypothetical protein